MRRRFIEEGRWREVSVVRDRMMVESKKAIPDKESRRAWVYGELDRMYPPIEKPAEPELVSQPAELVSPPSDSGQIQGLAEIPTEWPELQANAALATELQWVQANRLRIVEERPGRATLVRLDRAANPAPSWAALGWLETSIRSYAKFVDVAAKVSGGADDEGAVMRAERKSVDEIKRLLAEMDAAEGTCSHCGQPMPAGK